MFYAFSYTPDGSDTETDPYTLDLHLTQGVVHQVDVLFQDGCNHKIFVQLWDGDHQIWPTNRGEKFRGNATVISFREFYELLPGYTKLNAHIWTTLPSDFKEVIIQIGLLPKEVLQPLSFKELLKAATGVA